MSVIGNPLVSTNYQTNTFSGDGTTVAYTLSLAPASAASIAVYISGLYQTPSVAYMVSGTTLTFTGAPPTGTNNILVLHLGIKSSTLVPVDGSVTPSMLSNANVVFWSGANTNVGIGNTAPNAPLTIGAANGTFTNPLVQAASSANSWLQINAQNKSNGNNASTDLILARSDGNDSVGYIDMGINSNTYAQAAYSIMTPSSGYLFTNGGDLFLGTQTAHNVVIHTGNTTTGSARLTVVANGYVGIGTSTPDQLLKIHGAGSPAFIIKETGNNVSTLLYSNASMGFVGTQSAHDFNIKTSDTIRMTVSANGTVSSPLQPHGSWTVTVTGWTGSQFTRASTIYSNVGGCVAAVTHPLSGSYGRFTAPVAGRYLVTINGDGISPVPAFGPNGASAMTLICLYGSWSGSNNPSQPGDEFIDTRNGHADNTGASVVLNLAAGDYINPDWYQPASGYVSGGTLKITVTLLM